MHRVMNGETVLVRPRIWGVKDRLGNEVEVYDDPICVHRVLVAETSEEDRAMLRPDGIRVTVRMAFPRECSIDLRGAEVRVRDRWLLVSGEPMHVMSPLSTWDMMVLAGVVDG